MLVKDFNPHLGIKDDVVRDYMGLARAVAGRFRWASNLAAHIDFQDIVSEAYIGLIKAFDKFDGRVPKFTTYAVPMIQWEIQQFIRGKGQTIRIPQRLYSLIGHIFRNDLACAPLAEIVAKLGCSEIEAARALKYLKDGQASVSLDQPIASPKEGAEPSFLHDFVGQTPDLTCAHVGEFLDRLEPSERHFVRMRTAGQRPERPLIQTAVRTKLMAYMGLNESEVNQMSVELTKEKYLELRAQGRPDADIYPEFGMGQSQFYRKKKKWGLIGSGPSKSAVSKAKASNDRGGPTPVQLPAAKVSIDIWKAQYDNLSAQFAELSSADTAKTARLEKENALLKEMLKFYL